MRPTPAHERLREARTECGPARVTEWTPRRLWRPCGEWAKADGGAGPERAARKGPLRGAKRTAPHSQGEPKEAKRVCYTALRFAFFK